MILTTPAIVESVYRGELYDRDRNPISDVAMLSDVDEVVINVVNYRLHLGRNKYSEGTWETVECMYDADRPAPLDVEIWN